MVVRAARAWLPDGPCDDVSVVLSDAGIAEVRPGAPTDGPALPGLLLPGLVNAHVHLELDRPLVPGGRGLVEWVLALRGRGAPPGDGSGPAREARAFGTALVCDVSNGGHTAPALRAAGLAGVVQHEVLGLGRDTLPARLAVAERASRVEGPITVRPSPHATYSTHPELIRAAARPGGAPATIHLGEDPDERRFLERGEGSFAALLDTFGVDWRHLAPPGCGPVEWLDRLGVLGPDLLLVHGVDLDDADRARIAARGATVVLCPRSNLHVGGWLPDVPALLAAGVRIALGTDSLASVPDLDLLAEVHLLCAAFPSVPEGVFWRAATAGGADALRRPGYGRIAVGASPGLWLLGPDGERRWLA